MEDIAPALLEQIRADFQRRVSGDKSLAAILEKIDKGAATYAEANAYADRIGIHMSEALRANLSADILPDGKLYYNIAERIIPDTLLRGQGMIADTAAEVIEGLNKQAGVGLKAVKPAADADRIQGIVNAVSGRETYDRTAEKLLDEPVKLFALNAADETARENAAFQKKAGLKPKIRRTAGAGCCDWCAAVEGSWDYGDEPGDVYRRHAFCRCEVLFESGKGSYQDVWSKKTYDSREEAAREQRKYIGTRAESDQKRIERQNKLRPVLKANEESSARVRAVMAEQGKTERLTGAALEKQVAEKQKAAFVEKAPCVTTPEKITEYLLKPGAKHSQDFFNVGYTQDDALQLRHDIAKQFDVEKAYKKEALADGGEKFNIDMTLGVTEKKPFVTGWQIDEPGEKARIITAFRKGEKRDK